MSSTEKLAALLLERLPSWYGGNAGAAVNPQETAEAMAQRDADWLIEHLGASLPPPEKPSA